MTWLRASAGVWEEIRLFRWLVIARWVEVVSHSTLQWVVSLVFIARWAKVVEMHVVIARRGS